jgi:hypothetical protein
MQPETLNAAGVAGLLGLREDYFRSIRRKLEAGGFPPKLPGINKWSRFAVRQWIRTNGATHRPTERLEATAGNSLAALSIQLEKEYAA